ncbi:cholesterol 7-desaturase [Folsomia candida]|uniref:cholesterol 7-desaturase n=1 Tax=Folsomia candida TaxID=158441 RepID=A0A226DH08_FOLCA|nr:cholesterol 7-desaturase [Folsomia candida]OXA44503.1 Cholesterol desaturase daf-36 [Folsomia candida]
MDQDLFHIFMDFIYNFFENIILLQNLVPTVCLSAAIGYIFYWIFMKDYNFAEDFAAHGFEHLDKNGLTKDANKSSNSYKTYKINQLMKRRKIGNIPPHYPTGWFSILDSDSLKSGEVKEINVLGENLVAWRGMESDQVHVADAYCPHNGAHLGVGGTVRGDCIQCPFHHWRYRGGDGKLVEIPYAERKGAFSIHLKMWESMEANGNIYIWHDSDEKKSSWSIDIVPYIQNKRWKSCGKTEFEIACHIQEIIENGADIAHLDPLHGYSFSLGGWNILKTIYEAEWSQADKETMGGHVAVAKVGTDICFFNRWKFFRTDLTMYIIGPGIVQFNFDTMFGSGVMIQATTPIEPLLCLIRHQFYVSNIFLRPLGKLLLYLDKNQIAADISVWNRKQFLNKPRLAREDKFIPLFRRWYGQFYPERSLPNGNIQDKRSDF